MKRVLALLALASCIEHVPPPARPELVVPHPAVALGPPAAGEGVLLIDTVGGQANVVEVTGQTICVTPCEVHLAQGFHELHFVDPASHDLRGDGQVTIGAVPTAYRYALGRGVKFSPGLGVATLLLIAGGSLLFTGLVASSTTLDIVGGAGTALGGFGFFAFRPSEQPGTGVQWTPNAP